MTTLWRDLHALLQEKENVIAEIERCNLAPPACYSTPYTQYTARVTKRNALEFLLLPVYYVSIINIALQGKKCKCNE
jgi:hypothetical protein